MTPRLSVCCSSSPLQAANEVTALSIFPVKKRFTRQMAVSGTSAPCRSSAAAAFSMAGRRLPACPSARRGAGRGRGGGGEPRQLRSLLSSPLRRAAGGAGPPRRPGSRQWGGRLPPQPHGRGRRCGAGGGGRTAAAAPPPHVTGPPGGGGGNGGRAGGLGERCAELHRPAPLRSAPLRSAHT